MPLVSLLLSTGDDRADTMLRGAVSLWEQSFPLRIRGYYLTGSYANATATPSSDLDLTILFKDSYQDQTESDRAQQLCEALEALHPAIFIDMGYLSEQSLQQADRVSAALQLKLSSQLLYGEDSRDQICAKADQRYVRDAMHIPYFVSRYGRPNLERLRYPLDYPDPTSEFYGYDGWKLARPGDTDQTSSKLLVVIVTRIASALVALRSGEYVGSKYESVKLYRRLIQDEWGDLVEQVYHLCKERWQYGIPTKPKEREQLRALCQRTVAFENHFFGIYRSYLLAELENEQPENQLRAVERLGQIIYWGEEIDDALARLKDHAKAEVRDAAEKAQQQRVGVAS